MTLTDDHGSVRSSSYPINLGAPQGSCLGPLLFLIYVNDLHLHVLHCMCIMFADDTTIYKTHSNLNYLRWCIETDLTNIANWFKAHKLTLNVEKSSLIFFHKKKKHQKFEVSIDSLKIPQVMAAKFLGVWIDENLTWTTHINKVIGKLCKAKRLLQCSFKFLTEDAKKILYFAQCQSIVTYGLVVWGNMGSKGSLGKLDKLISKCQKLTEATYSGKLFSLSQLITLETKKLCYKFFHGDLPINIEKALSSDSMNKSLKKSHPYATRKKAIVNIPRATTKDYKNSFLSRCIVELSAVPVATLRLPTIRHFITECRKDVS